MASARAGSSAAVCRTSGICYTYDVEGRPVEINNAGTVSEILYSLYRNPSLPSTKLLGNHPLG